MRTLHTRNISERNMESYQSDSVLTSPTAKTGLKEIAPSNFGSRFIAFLMAVRRSVFIVEFVKLLNQSPMPMNDDLMVVEFSEDTVL